jgi:flagellar protein FliS
MLNEAYLENKVLAADQLELIALLYDGAKDAVRDARSRLASGEIGARSQAISKAIDIVAELNISLNHGAGGEVSRNLARLYEYIGHRLLEANIQQSDEPLAECVALLNTLSEAWSSVRAQIGASRSAPDLQAGLTAEHPADQAAREPANPWEAIHARDTQQAVHVWAL